MLNAPIDKLITMIKMILNKSLLLKVRRLTRHAQNSLSGVKCEGTAKNVQYEMKSGKSEVASLNAEIARVSASRQMKPI